MVDLASRGLKYIKGKHLLLTENEVNNSKTGSNKGKKLEKLSVPTLKRLHLY